jgi:hypothetical protein
MYTSFTSPKENVLMTVVDDMGHLYYYPGEKYNSNPSPSWFHDWISKARGNYWNEFWVQSKNAKYPINCRLQKDPITKHTIQTNGQQINLTVHWNMSLP